MIHALEKFKSLEKGELSCLIRKRLWTKKARLISRFCLNSCESKLEKHLMEHVVRDSPCSYTKYSEKPFYFDLEDFATIRDINKEALGRIENNITKHADKLCRRNFIFLNSSFSFTNKINWHLDPVSKSNWPKVFYQDIAYMNSERIGDIKLPWELNRHQYLVTLAQAYFLSLDEKYSKEVVSMINSWIDDNPPYIGINWISPLEAGIRLISWTWAFHLIRQSDEVNDKFIKKFLTSILIQTDYIENNLSIGRYSNNHLVGEAASLAVVGMYFSEFKKAENWRKKGLSILEEEILKQLFVDGGGAEQAVSYLRFIVEFFFLAFLLASKNNIKVSFKAIDRLEKAFEFMMLTLMPDGKAPKFGDSDDARAIFLNGCEYWDFRGILALGAALFDRSDFKWVSGFLSEELIWLLGKHGFENYERLKAEMPNKKAYLFKDSGYAVIRDSWDIDANYLIFDCGPLGYKTGAHGHADALSIQMAAFGCQTLIDPGTFAYNQDSKYRNYFRGTKSHNTVSVDGKNQAEITGTMSWANIPKTRVIEYYFGDQMNMISAENDGYCKLSNPVTHQRTVISWKKPVYYLLIDKMTADSVHKYGLHFHFPPGTVASNDDNIIASPSSNCNLFLSVKCSHAFYSEIKEGDLAPMGWYSESYGHITESPSLSYICNANGSIFFYSLIVPFAKKIPKISHFEGHEQDGSTHLIIEYGGFRDTWLLNDIVGTTSCRDISFVGKALVASQDSNGSLISAYGITCTRLAVDGRTYFASSDPINGFILKQIKEY